MTLLVATAESSTIKSDCLAAPTYEMFEKAESCLADKDRGCVNQMIASGDAAILKSGTEVTITDTKIFQGAVKVRIRGTTTEVWVSIGAVDVK